MFKIGDTVKRIGKDSGKVLNGKVYTVEKGGDRDIVWVLGHCYKSVFFKLVKKEKKKHSPKAQWSFYVHDLTEIDGLEILKELTRENPVALVRLGDGRGQYYLHPSLKYKAYFLGMRGPVIKKETEFTEVMQFVRKVRQAKWNTPQQKITVQLPEVK